MPNKRKKSNEPTGKYGYIKSNQFERFPLLEQALNRKQSTGASVFPSLRNSIFHKRNKLVTMGTACTKHKISSHNEPETELRAEKRSKVDSVSSESSANNLAVKHHSGMKSSRISPAINSDNTQTMCSDNSFKSTLNVQEDLNTTISMPNLHSSPVSRPGRSQLKYNVGSTNLMGLDKNLLTSRRTSADVNQHRHSSSKNVLDVVKRKKRLPTKENGIHVLEADQVNYYQILDEVGRGSFGSVCKCLCHKDNTYYAMKIMSKKRLMRKNGLLARHPRSKTNPLAPLNREIAILKKMDHPSIVKLIEVIDDVQVDNIYMVFELMTEGVVMEVPTKKVIEESKARKYFRDLLLGIEYLHYSKIIHRDIKPSNLLLDENDHIKIADFGVSDIFKGDDDLLNRYAGSPAFQAPEVLNHESRNKYSGRAVDVWAMGVTLYCFLYGECPFYSNNLGELCDQIKTQPVTFPDEPVLNPQASDLILRTLAKQAKDRITVLEMKDHPWVTEAGVCPLPQTDAHCSVIEVTDEEVRNSIKIISKLSSLVVAKSILKGKSFMGNIRLKARHRSRVGNDE